MAFQFDLEDEVIDASGNEGVIIGRFEFVNTSPGYLVSYENGTFTQYQSESALTKKQEEQ